MASNCSPSPQLAGALALVELLTDHPELSCLTWTVDTVGVLHGQQTDDTSAGRIIDDCARVLGGTPVRSHVRRGDDSLGVAELVALWRGVHVEVWASYDEGAPAPRRLGTVAVVAAGGAR